MSWLDQTLSYLLPHALVDETPWKDEWDRQQNEAFVRSCQITFAFIAIGYTANFFFFDIPMRLEPIEQWALFRGSLVAFFLALFLFYRTKYAYSKYYRIPALIGGFVLCHSQAWVTIFYGKEAWVFFFFFVLFTCIYLRLTSFQSFLWCCLVIGISLPILLNGDVGTQNIMSGAIVSTLGAVIIRSTALTEVRLFLANQENDAAQKRVVELTADYAERVKTFIPKVIADRLTMLMEDQRMNVVEASIQALKSRKKLVACLFTDIRGFTQGSKNLDGFITNSVMPEVASCSDAIESHQGIPRKIGDLIFAYFDDDDVKANILGALLSAYEIARINESMNASSNREFIKRYILLSFGEAMVGNFGGLDTSIEITALGSPVNYLSRIDELTKAEGLAHRLNAGDIVYDEATHKYLLEFGLDIEHEIIDLASLGLVIRDFPEVNRIFLHSPSDEGYEKLLSMA
ncbi:MAG: hypothetical protein RIC89_03690 [Pseudomonadales bacterium]